MEFAIEHGYELLHIHEGIVFPEKVLPFKSFIEKALELLHTYKDTSIEKTVKLMQNSLYGYFDSNKIQNHFCIATNDESIEDGLCIDYDLRIWCRRIEDRRMNSMPHWTAWIRAHARLDLIRLIYALGPEHVLYVDTYSITVAADTDTSAIQQSLKP